MGAITFYLALSLLIISMPAAISILVVGLARRRPWLGFGLGFLPILLFGILVRAGLVNSTPCPAPPAPCEGPGLVYFLGTGLTILYLAVYIISAVVIFAIYRLMFDPQHAVVHKPVYKAAILSAMVVIILIGLGMVIFNQNAIFEALTNVTLATLQLLY